MHKLSLIGGLSIVLLTGCAPKSPESAIRATPEATIQATEPSQPQETASIRLESSQAKRLQVCRQELEAMQVYNKESYTQYNNEVQKLTAAINKYRKVQESVGAEINDIMMPQTEFHMRELCFRIKNQLMQLMVKQV